MFRTVVVTHPTSIFPLPRWSVPFAGLLLTCLALQTTCGSVIFSDNFAYPDGPVTTAPGTLWSDFSGGGSNNEVLVVSGRLQISSSRSEDVSAPLIGQPYATNSGVTIYASFMVNFSGLPGVGTYFAEYNATSSRCRIWATTTGAASGAFHLSIGNYTGATAISGQLTNDLVLNSNYTVVTRYDTGSGLSTIWLNPSAETNISVTATDSPSPGNITTIAFRQASSEGTMFIDNLLVGTTFADVTPASNAPPVITSQPQSQSAHVGDTVGFPISVTGAQPLSFQWWFNQTNLLNGATNQTLTLVSVTTNQTGSYSVTVSNFFGVTNSLPAALTIVPVVVLSNNAFTYLDYNVDGNSVTGTDPTNWAVTAPQVQAIGRQLTYLKPDIIALNEIPTAYKWQMTNWVTAFLPGYYIATNAVGDGFINNFIASRWPILSSASHLHNSNLDPYGYTNSNFTRDLFEAQIALPGSPLPLHVFVAHLKATDSATPQNDANKRAAEASAVSNYFAVTYLTSTNATHPYILSGDLNESAFFPDSSYVSGQPIQRLFAPATGLQYTDPVNPITHTDLTESIRLPLDTRFDYILPCGILFSNIVSSQVFRTGLLSPLPAGLNANDDKISSDHLPVLMVFNNPYSQSIRVTGLAYSNPGLTVQWNTYAGGTYRVETSTNLNAWSVLVSNLVAASTNYQFTTNLNDNTRFFRIRSP